MVGQVKVCVRTEMCVLAGRQHVWPLPDDLDLSKDQVMHAPTMTHM